MTAVQSADVPKHSFLGRYQDGGAYADCYVVEVPAAVSQQQFVEAFYTSPLFKVERALLKVFAATPASDDEARDLAAGRAAKFSAWRVEAQSASELLLADVTGRTRSWLMATPGEGASTTLLHFGSAVVPRTHAGTGRPRMGAPFRALLGFHRLYSRLLLAAASRRVGHG